MEKDLDWMRIADLERLSGLPRRTIHFYVQSGLLHTPKRTGKTMAYYDENHLKKLFFIRDEKKRGLPLNAIRDKIASIELKKEASFEYNHTGFLNLEKEHPDKKRNSRSLGNKNRKSILELGCRLFLEKGLRDTKVSDITKELNIGKGTFYFYFSDKKELLLECIPLIFEKMFSIGWEKVRKIEEPLDRLRARGEMVFPVLKEFCSIIQLSKEAIEDPDPKIKKLGEDTYKSIRLPLESDIKRGIDRGVFQSVDPRVASTLMIGMMENVYYLQTIDKSIEKKTIWNSFTILIKSGVWLDKND